jgi:diacylglycerol O-acyltransferase / wax synthase
MDSRFRRLSLFDRVFLRLERPDLPEHVAGLCVLEAAPLLDAGGELDLERIKRRLERRLIRVPELRQVVRNTPPLCGLPLWVDDPGFSIAHHVHAVAVHPPGDQAGFLGTAELLLRPLLDRSRPLWELWFVTGLQGGRLGLVFKIHHSIADGLAAVALAGSLLDLEPDASDPPAVPWSPQPPPPARALLADGVRCRASAAAAVLRHPLRLARKGAAAAVGSADMLRKARSAAPRTSLNRLPGWGRRLRAVHLDLEAARTVAHAHGATVNDVLLCVVAGGVADLLVARGERIEGLELKASVPATLRRADAARQLGNAAGAIVVGLPAGERHPVRRLEAIAASSRAAKAEQQRSAAQDVFGLLGTSSRLVRWLTERQRMVNFFVSNVPGPPVPLYLLGARIEDVMPVIGLAGNVTLMFAALSYCGRLSLVVNADAAAYPDLDVLAAGMERAWRELGGESKPAGPAPAGQAGQSGRPAAGKPAPRAEQAEHLLTGHLLVHPVERGHGAKAFASPIDHDRVLARPP